MVLFSCIFNFFIFFALSERIAALWRRMLLGAFFSKLFAYLCFWNDGNLDSPSGHADAAIEEARRGGIKVKLISWKSAARTRRGDAGKTALLVSSASCRHVLEENWFLRGCRRATLVFVWTTSRKWNKHYHHKYIFTVNKMYFPRLTLCFSSALVHFPGLSHSD